MRAKIASTPVQHVLTAHVEPKSTEGMSNAPQRPHRALKDAGADSRLCLSSVTLCMLSSCAGMVKILSQLSAGERASIEGEVVMVPAMHGPLMYPAADLVYNDAPWLMDRLRQSRVRLVHPDVGDEVRHMMRCLFSMMGVAIYERDT